VSTDIFTIFLFYLFLDGRREIVQSFGSFESFESFARLMSLQGRSCVMELFASA
jgi:hypothetical protein